MPDLHKPASQKMVELLSKIWFMDSVYRMLALFANNGDAKKLKADLEEAQKKINKLKEENSALKARLAQLEDRVAAQFL